MPNTKTSAQFGTSGHQVAMTQTPSRLKALYRLVKKVSATTGLFRFHLSSELLGQEMECIINSDDVVQFATIQVQIALQLYEARIP